MRLRIGYVHMEFRSEHSVVRLMGPSESGKMYPIELFGISHSPDPTGPNVLCNSTGKGLQLLSGGNIAAETEILNYLLQQGLIRDIKLLVTRLSYEGYQDVCYQVELPPHK